MSIFIRCFCLRVLPFAFAWLLLSQEMVLGQTDSTRMLDEVLVKTFAPTRFMAGLKIQRIDSATIEQAKFQTLAEFLNFLAPVNFRPYGNGQLTSIGLRGTSSNHTAVVWNGININSPSTGQSDFSTLPAAGFDLLAIQYGSSSCVVGSDAVGGSILLDSRPVWENKMQLSFGQRMASFNNRQTQLSARVSGNRVSSKTVFYSGVLNNNYPYTERNYYPVERSTTSSRGFIQDLFYLTKKQNQLSLNVWVSDNNVEISPQSIHTREVLQTQAVRILNTYQFKKLTVRGGYVQDITNYGKGNFVKPSRTAIDRFLIRAEHAWKISKLTAHIGTEAAHVIAHVDEYEKNTIAENRLDIFAWLRYQVSKRLLASLNVRQAFVKGFEPPLAPALGFEYQLTESTKLTGNVSRSYRVPTMNERYWSELGNPELKPEDGFNKEMGISWNKQHHTFSFSSSMNLYHNLIDNWAYWNPDLNYKVQNLQQVLAKGLELTHKTQYQREQLAVGFHAQYAYTHSSQQKAYNVFSADVIGKQLIYIPKHNFTANLYYQTNGKTGWLKKHGTPFRATLQWQANSRRYYTFDNSKWLDGQHLANLILESGLKWKHADGRLFFQINNLFDELYLNSKRNAMPGRNYAINFVFNINK
ncbi:TonB-dependent siderophore receptor [Emticicia sp. 21SJ11W-3]|uniref:TonB-dependent receptor plug domain-containing protein n=1 Tax=Emticicia sp. 21SJ11W-3 TaxID=2916755 RepID=UPI00209FFC00|nr:TonB-dependent receptor [Emticicia sp. 21SJ11W-3]UTA69479.1 TonB-dependent receptor [Emticicia sp. 21SJ11W-3]